MTRHLNFSTSSLDNAGNSTGIPMASALASLEWLRRDRAVRIAMTIGLLGIAAGACCLRLRRSASERV